MYETLIRIRLVPEGVKQYSAILTNQYTGSKFLFIFVAGCVAKSENMYSVCGSRLPLVTRKFLPNPIRDRPLLSTQTRLFAVHHQTYLDSSYHRPARPTQERPPNNPSSRDGSTKTSPLTILTTATNWYVFFSRSHLNARQLPAAVMTHLCLGSCYAWSVINEPIIRSLGVVTSASCDWSLAAIAPVFSLMFVVHGLSAAIVGKWQEKVGPRASGAVQIRQLLIK